MRFFWIQLALGLFQTDWAVKQEIENHPELDQEHALCGGAVKLHRLHNHGTAGSRFLGHMPSIIRFSGLLTIGCIGAFFRTLCRTGHVLQKLGFTLLTGGACSNLYDRCKKGYVVDYISFRTPFRRLNDLVFNLSDFFIFAGAILICLGQTDRTQR